MYGLLQRVANAVVKCKVLTKHVENVQRILSNGVSGLRSKKQPVIIEEMWEG